MFVAREQEMVRLGRLLEKALAGQGRVCLVAGEPGAGKTTLATEFAARALADHDALIVGLVNCNPHTGSGDPYLPFRELLALLTGDVAAGAGQGNVTKGNASRLHRFLRVSGEALVESGPDLVGLFIPGGSLLTRLGAKLSSGNPLAQRVEQLLQQHTRAGAAPNQQQILEQYTNVLRTAASRQPLVLVLDDLHWADAASLELFFHLARRIEQTPILLIGTYRPNDVALGRGSERHPLEPVLNELKRYHGEIVLDLDGAGEIERRRMVEAMIDAEPNRLNPTFRESLFAHTEGHPLFTAELLRYLQDSGVLTQDPEGCWVQETQPDWGVLPARVEGVIEERMGRLDDALRGILNVASVEGEEFTAEVVARVCGMAEREVNQLLGREAERRHRLITHRGVRRVEEARLSTYRFCHNQFQRYLYQRLGEGERALLHEDVGLTLERLHEGHEQEIVARLARHFLLSQNVPKAIAYLFMAGREAVRLSANQEAILHLTRAVELSRSTPDSPERDQQELALLLTLVTPLMATRGYAATEVGDVLSRGRELADRIGPTPHSFPLLWGLWLFHSVGGQLAIGSRLAQRCFDIADASGDPELLLEGHAALGTMAFYRGELTAAHHHAEHSLALYDAERHAAHAFMYGQDPAVVACGFSARALALRGDLTGAQERLRALAELTERLAHRHSIGTACMQLTVVHLLLRDDAQAARWAEKMIALSSEWGLLLYLGMGRMLLGTARLGIAAATDSTERVEAAIAVTLQGVAEYRGTGAVLDLSPCFGAIAAAYATIGRQDEALGVIEEALAHVEATGQRYYESELVRLQGEVLRLRPGGAERAELLFRQALDIAHAQDARLLELRAAMSLARLARQRDPVDDGALLRDHLQGFAGTPSCADVEQARAWLRGTIGV